MKSTVEEIRARFDADVERFSDLDAGVKSQMDSALARDLIVDVIAATTPKAHRFLDIGCGGGNYAVSLAERFPGSEITLIDLSRPMLDRAMERAMAAGAAAAHTIQGDVRELDLGTDKYCAVVASTVLHHLRGDDEWENVFCKIGRAVSPGGSFWIYDVVEATNPAINEVMWKRFGDYLVAQQDEAYRDHVFGYIAHEDTPKSLMFQLQQLARASFTEIDVLHKTACFAAFGGCKPKCGS